ncbi:MAG: Stk1 family PASTA domain-containing Ser/Thr kinase [Nitriliruptoraceae bacterium]
MSVGRVLGDRYELTRILGRGGMAEVYAAHDRVLDRHVAVKLLLERFKEDSAFTRRFSDEARHAARLNHPNLVAVYDTGSADGQPFIVMELVDGRSLQEALAEGTVDVAMAVTVVAAVSKALGYAHDRGVIHRDVKPGNIMLANDGSVKVTDFGIARAIGNDTVTRTAAVLGTAAYLSPEQAQGGALDPRSDLYSLGVVLYEALTGSQPFRGDSPVTVAYQHVQEQPRPPRERNPDISVALEAVVLRAMAKNPANRYQHASDMYTDLTAARDGQPIVAPPLLSEDATLLLEPELTERATRHNRRQTRQRRTVAVLLGLIGLLAIIGIGYGLASLFSGDATEFAIVPDVVGEPEAVAVALVIRDGFEPVLRYVVVDDEPYDIVLAQSPTGLSEAAAGSQVVLQIAARPETTTVPNINGLPEDAALAALREAGLVRGTVSRATSSSVPQGSVISSDPSQGTIVPRGSAVSYVVSDGEETVRVRPVTNTAESDAVTRLREQGLEVAIERSYSPTVPDGFVISQDPPAGTEVPVGSIVTIVVSQGVEATTEAPPADPPENPGNGGGNGEGNQN